MAEREETTPVPAVHRSIEIEADPSEVWKAIVDENERSQWLDAQAEPNLESVIPQRHIGWTWDDDDGMASRVSIDLTPTPSGTRVDVIETPLTLQNSVLAPRAALSTTSHGARAGGGRVEMACLELEHMFMLRADRRVGAFA